jgi:hypothetical protein
MSMNDTVLFADSHRESLACECIFHLQSFMVGSEIGFAQAQVDQQASLNLRNRFRNFIAQKYPSAPSVFIALYHASVSPKESLERYFMEWKLFFEPESVHQAPLASGNAPRKTINVYPLIENLKAHPHSLVPSKRASHIKAFLNGLDYAISHPATGGRMEPTVEDFSLWLRGIFQQAQDCPWEMYLLGESGGNDEAAFERFFFLLEDFKRKGQPRRLS